MPHEHYRQAIDEASPTLADLRSQGVVSAVGAGLAHLDLLIGFAREADFDCIMLPNRYTLTEQTAFETFMPSCQDKGIAIILAAPYNQGRTLGHPNQPQDALDHLRRYQEVCQRHGVPIKAAALQFVAAHPSVISVIPGPGPIEELQDNIRMTQQRIPDEFWQELLSEGLIAAGCPMPAD